MTAALSSDERERLADMAYEIRRLTVEMVAYGQWGHIAGSVSMAEILAVLYQRELRVRPDEPHWEERDRLVLSKAHASPGLYAALALRGFYPLDEVYDYCEMGGRLEGHADMTVTPGLEASGGLLGLGLSQAQGMALGLRLNDFEAARAYCILGDGEMHEGAVWEAAMSAAHYGLDNLIAILDYNKSMSRGTVASRLTIEPIADKWRAFGWDVLEADGHDLDELAAALHDARWVTPRGRPVMVIAHTVKGMGIPEAAGRRRWHTHAPDPATADRMLRELARAYGRPETGYARKDAPVKKEALPVREETVHVP
jgi:transketolase